MHDQRECVRCRVTQDSAEFYTGRKTCRTCYSSLRQTWPSYDKHTRRKARIAYTYNVTYEYFTGLLAYQGGACAICSVELRPELDYKKAHHPVPVVDHDHGSGEVRGVLCSSCNLMLGKAKDCVDVLKAAVRYLTSGGVSPAFKDSLNEETDKDAKEDRYGDGGVC